MKRTITKGLAATAFSLAAMASQASNIYVPYVDMTGWPTPILDNGSQRWGRVGEVELIRAGTFSTGVLDLNQ